VQVCPAAGAAVHAALEKDPGSISVSVKEVPLVGVNVNQFGKLTTIPIGSLKAFRL